MPKVLKALLPLALFAGLAIFLAIGLTRDPSTLPSELIDRPMPEFDLTTLDGDAITQDDLVGEVALINVFGSWCVACLQEHPTLMQLARDDTVKIVGVNWRDERGDALAWLDKHGDPYDTIVFDAESDLVIEIGVTGAPETFVLDPTGRIRYKQIGPITDEVWRDTILPVINAIELEQGAEAGAS